MDPDSPIAWDEKLTPTELSYNNILDLSSAYALACDLAEIDSQAQGVVIVKHNNPCGVAVVRVTEKTGQHGNAGAQLEALQNAWGGDPVSAFGGVLAFTHPLEIPTATWLHERFVELVAAPGDMKVPLEILRQKRKNLKAVRLRRLGAVPSETVVRVPGGRLHQTSDVGTREEIRGMTKAPWKVSDRLARFGIAVCRALKSNAIALVREAQDGSLQLVGAGQGQPNRVEALQKLAIPRALEAFRAEGVDPLAALGECLMVSDAFFPFRDTVDTAAAAGIRQILQPGGSIKDAESIKACDEHGVAMAFTGIRHFRH
jgi:phosphoribosylaminoimidazolecarboxamide formyltransferase/IMP cyclohydrolase